MRRSMLLRRERRIYDKDAIESRKIKSVRFVLCGIASQKLRLLQAIQRRIVDDFVGPGIEARYADGGARPKQATGVLANTLDFNPTPSLRLFSQCAVRELGVRNGLFRKDRRELPTRDGRRVFPVHRSRSPSNSTSRRRLRRDGDRPAAFRDEFFKPCRFAGAQTVPSRVNKTPYRPPDARLRICRIRLVVPECVNDAHRIEMPPRHRRRPRAAERNLRRSTAALLDDALCVMLVVDVCSYRFRSPLSLKMPPVDPIQIEPSRSRWTTPAPLSNPGHRLGTFR